MFGSRQHSRTLCIHSAATYVSAVHLLLTTALRLNNSVLWTSRHDGDAFLRGEILAVNIDCQVPEYSTAVWYIPVSSCIPVRLRRERGPWVISGFYLQVDETCTLLGRYATCSVKFLPKFQDILSVPSSRIKNPSWSLKMRPLVCLETSVRNYKYTLRNIPEESISRNRAW
jgi:hypothetical protein